MSTRTLRLTALVFCILVSQSTQTTEAIALQAPPAQTATEGERINPDQLRRTLMGRDTDEDGVNDLDDNCTKVVALSIPSGHQSRRFLVGLELGLDR